MLAAPPRQRGNPPYAVGVDVGGLDTGPRPTGDTTVGNGVSTATGNPYIRHTHKFQVDGGQDLRNKTLNDLVENIRHYFYDLGVGKDFLNKVNLSA